MITPSITKEVNIMKVYIVTSQEMYDYDTKIEAVFFDEELANGFVYKSNLDGLQIEEMEVYE